MTYTFYHTGFVFRDMQAYKKWLSKSPSDVQQFVEKLREESVGVAERMKVCSPRVLVCRDSRVDLISHYTPDGANPLDGHAVNDAGLKLLEGLSMDACEKWIDAMSEEEIAGHQGLFAKPFHFGIMLPIPGDSDVSELWNASLSSTVNDDGLVINQRCVALNG